MSKNCTISFPIRLYRSRLIRQVSGLLLLSVVLLVLHHVRRTDPQVLVNSSPASPTQHSGTGDAVRLGRDRNPGLVDAASVHHKLLQFDDSLQGSRSMDVREDENELNKVTHVPSSADLYVYQKKLEDDSVGEHDENTIMDEIPANTEDGNHDTVSHQIENSSSAAATRYNQIRTSLAQDNALMNHLENGLEQNVHSAVTSDHTKYSIGNIHPPTQDHCDISGIKSWAQGVVTELHPRIKADCTRLRNNDRPEITRVKRELRSWQSSESEEDWRETLSDCDKVVKEFSDNFYNSPEELEFPLAYILVVYTNPRQMVRLIKALWRPQNLFCIHPDAKQSNDFINVFRQLSKCLDNVFLPNKLEKVYYQHHTIMDSQMNCYEDLLTHPSSRWKYVINLCGRELPLKTNREMVRSLKTLKGSSAIETKHVQSKGFLTRDRFTWKAAEDFESGKLHYTNSRLAPPPIPLYKSFNFIAISQPFVHFIVNDRKAIEFRNYLKDVKIPEEEFYASLVHLPGVPGGLPPHRVPLPTIDKYIWMNKNTQTRAKSESCEGRMVHFICIVGVGDLDQIYRLGVYRKPPVFFFNKYFMEEDHVVMDCMEERLLQQNRLEYQHDCLLHEH